MGDHDQRIRTFGAVRASITQGFSPAFDPLSWDVARPTELTDRRTRRKNKNSHGYCLDQRVKSKALPPPVGLGVTRRLVASTAWRLYTSLPNQRA